MLAQRAARGGLGGVPGVGDGRNEWNDEADGVDRAPDRGHEWGDCVDSWVRIERDLAFDIDRMWPDEGHVRVVGVRINVNDSSMGVYIKGNKFSNLITVEHPPSSRLRRTGPPLSRLRETGDCAEFTTKWPAYRSLDEVGFHYDQVGSILSEVDASSNISATHYQDAFGVRLAGWETDISGWNP